VHDDTEVPEVKPWKVVLPVTWTVQQPGQVLITELTPADPEFMEVERNLCKTCAHSVKEVVSVRETLRVFLLIFIVVYTFKQQVLL